MSKKYNRHGTARQRYYAEYHENRMLKSYLNSVYEFGGDRAKQNGYRSWQLRFIPSFERRFVLRGVHYYIVRW